MLNAQFFVGYTAGQLGWQIVGDESCLTAPIWWRGGQIMGGFNTCFDPRSTELYAWCGDLRATTNILHDWAESLLLCPDEGGKAWQGLTGWPELAKEKLEELKDMVDKEVELCGIEVLIDSSWVNYRLTEIGLLENFLAASL